MAFIARSPEEALDFATVHCAQHLPNLTPYEADSDGDICVPGVGFIPRHIDVDGEDAVTVDYLKRPSKEYFKYIMIAADDDDLRNNYREIYEASKEPHMGKWELNHRFRKFWK